MRTRLAIVSAVLAAGCRTSSPAAPLDTVSWVDLERYSGTWHEIALYPNRFQQECASDTTATYEPSGEGRIAVRNRCRRRDGSEISVDGLAEVVDPKTNARLKVSFLPPWLRWTGLGRGDYWVIYLSPDYRQAIVGEPSRAYLWILSRSPKMSEAEYEALMPKVRAAGYDPARLQRATSP